MSDTIEWLETIGKDAGLRYAPAEELARTLGQAEASDALMTAVRSGDSARLSAELGQGPMHVDHATQVTGHEEDDPDDNDNGPEDRPDPDRDDAPPADR